MLLLLALQVGATTELRINSVAIIFTRCRKFCKRGDLLCRDFQSCFELINQSRTPNRWRRLLIERDALATNQFVLARFCAHRACALIDTTIKWYQARAHADSNNFCLITEIDAAKRTMVKWKFDHVAKRLTWRFVFTDECFKTFNTVLRTTITISVWFRYHGTKSDRYMQSDLDYPR